MNFEKWKLIFSGMWYDFYLKLFMKNKNYNYNDLGSLITQMFYENLRDYLDIQGYLKYKKNIDILIGDTVLHEDHYPIINAIIKFSRINDPITEITLNNLFISQMMDSREKAIIKIKESEIKIRKNYLLNDISFENIKNIKF